MKKDLLTGTENSVAGYRTANEREHARNNLISNEFSALEKMDKALILATDKEAVLLQAEIIRRKLILLDLLCEEREERQWLLR